jgi:SpoVK/Ycf46/Vps4 family AAA+-type ATPase
MMPNLAFLISRIIRLPTDALIWEGGRMLAEYFPDRYILETDDYDFDLEEYARSGRCSIHPIADDAAQFQATWRNQQEGAILKVRNAYLEVLWRGKRLHVLTVSTDEGYRSQHWVMADDMETARSFFSAVCAHRGVVEGSILVFQSGMWRRDAKLLRDIEAFRLEDLVLPEAAQRGLFDDVEGFFASKELYEAMGVTWKRGVLLVGPPGNGKTHAIKAMIQKLGLPCLYVRSFRDSDNIPEDNIEAVFARARLAAPCIVVLEDLDSLVEPSYLSSFLNAMDGFASNDGVLTIATTNHPEKIDVALLERPSRFDRKIEFGLPKVAERRRYLGLLDAKRPDEMRYAEGDLDRAAEATDGYSFALLKELHVSASMAWMRDRKPGSMGEVTLALVETLRPTGKSKSDKGKKGKKSRKAASVL